MPDGESSGFFKLFVDKKVIDEYNITVIFLEVTAMKKFKGVVWGILLVAIGALWCLDIVGILNFTLFFDGWWTLIIIVPSFIDLITEKNKTGSIIGLAIGVLLLLACQNIIDFGMIIRLAVPIILLVIGINIIVKSIFGRRVREKARALKTDKPDGLKSYCAVFSGVEPNFENVVFEGCEATAIFGGVDLDLRRAYINEDVYIEVCCIFGGVDIKLPEGVNVRVSTIGMFGGVSDKHGAKNSDTAATVYISGTNIFGGTDIV